MRRMAFAIVAGTALLVSVLVVGRQEGNDTQRFTRMDSFRAFASLLDRVIETNDEKFLEAQAGTDDITAWSCDVGRSGPAKDVGDILDENMPLWAISASHEEGSIPEDIYQAITYLRAPGSDAPYGLPTVYSFVPTHDGWTLISVARGAGCWGGPDVHLAGGCIGTSLCMWERWEG